MRKRELFPGPPRVLENDLPGLSSASRLLFRTDDVLFNSDLAYVHGFAFGYGIALSVVFAVAGVLVRSDEVWIAAPLAAGALIFVLFTCLRLYIRWTGTRKLGFAHWAAKACIALSLCVFTATFVWGLTV